MFCSNYRKEMPERAGTCAGWMRNFGKKHSVGGYKAAVVVIGMALLSLCACGSEDDGMTVFHTDSDEREESVMESRNETAREGKSKTGQHADVSVDISAPETRNMCEELEPELEEKIRTLYEQRLLLREAVRTIVAEEIQSTSFVTVDPKKQFSVTEVLIDEATGNPIVSESVKEFLQAAEDGKSIQDMCSAALEEGVSQIPDYLAGTMESSLQDAVTSLIGVDIFTPISVISQWMNPDQEPTVLLQGIVEEQQKDVSALLLFMEQEDVGAADIIKVAQMMQAVGQRAQEITAAQGGVRDYVSHAFTLRDLANQYADVEEQLAAYGEIVLPDVVPEFDEEKQKQISGLQTEISEKLKQYEPLYTLTVGNISVNYDVEGFREAQKSLAQAGMLSDLIFGDLVGGLMEEGGQTFNGQIQQNRRNLCDQLTDYMEESYVETVTAQETFMRKYSILLHLSQAVGNDLYFMDLYMEKHEWEKELEEAAQIYMTALSRYVIDLGSANILYNCILTSQQTNYLFDLQIEEDSVYQALTAVDPLYYEYGYSNDEITQRWNGLVDSYVESIEFLVEMRAGLGEAPGFYSNGSGKYNGTEYRVYTKEFADVSRPVLITGGNSSYYYDMNGYLICIDTPSARITQRNMNLLSFLSKTEGAELKTRWNDPDSPEIANMYEQSLTAQELYDYFWNGN